MKKLLLLTLCFTLFAFAKTLKEYIDEAYSYHESNQFDQAIATMEQAIDVYPDSSEAYTQLGTMIGEKAQRMTDYTAMFDAIGLLFAVWDKALSLDQHNFTALFHRAAWAVNVPKFFGRLEQGIRDLEMLVQLLQQSPEPELQRQLVNAYELLAIGYQKQGWYTHAKETWEMIIQLTPETDQAQYAQVNIDNIVYVETWLAEQENSKTPESEKLKELEALVTENPNNVGMLVALGKTYYDEQRYEKAARVLQSAVIVDSANIEAYKFLVLSLQEMTETGYDPRINLDTDYLTDLAFAIMSVLEDAVRLAPDDAQLRVWRGVMGVEMPFFVGTLDQGIRDLETVLSNDIPEDIRAEALYYLGVAYNKKAMTRWIEVVTQYPQSQAAADVFVRLHPGVKHIDLTKIKKPAVIIDFVMGFRDELAPQTAVWVETKDGEFVKTVYVSGFSGHAQYSQVNLPMWTKSSKFADADAVTAASIDLGHHIYVWDLLDYTGKKVKAGEYKICVEVAFWPSMQYQRVETPINIGKKSVQSVKEEGNLIPYMEVKYEK